jgi:hypothetical protein
MVCFSTPKSFRYRLCPCKKSALAIVLSATPPITPSCASSLRLPQKTKTLSRLSLPIPHFRCALQKKIHPFAQHPTIIEEMQYAPRQKKPFRRVAWAAVFDARVLLQCWVPCPRTRGHVLSDLRKSASSASSAFNSSSPGLKKDSQRTRFSQTQSRMISSSTLSKGGAYASNRWL